MHQIMPHSVFMAIACMHVSRHLSGNCCFEKNSSILGSRATGTTAGNCHRTEWGDFKHFSPSSMLLITTQRK
ncbi:hypothetical protein XENTR_v10011902 [Xenopus tropicalis]|nr:hypothetical protein XENTR_v10011902 [Xenopus tropicalis]